MTRSRISSIVASERTRDQPVLKDKLLLSDALLAEAVREGCLTASLVAAEGPAPRLPVATWDALARELDDNRGDR